MLKETFPGNQAKKVHQIIQERHLGYKYVRSNVRIDPTGLYRSKTAYRADA